MAAVDLPRVIQTARGCTKGALMGDQTDHKPLHPLRIRTRRNQTCQQDIDRKTMQVLGGSERKTTPGKNFRPEHSEAQLTLCSPWQRGAGYEH